MSGALILLAIGLLLIGLLVSLVRRSDPGSSSESPLRSDDVPLNAYLAFEERHAELLDRIFGPDDWEFVLSCASKPVQRLFVKERKDVAFYWLSQVRSRAKATMRIHVAYARNSTKLQPALELKLAIDYFMIRVKCEFVAAILWVGGPTALRTMIKQGIDLSQQLRGLLELASKAETLPSETRVPR